LSPKTTRRGYDQSDRIWFCEEALVRLRTAAEDIRWLLDRGYRVEPAVEFVGSHYQLLTRQRNALQRAACSSQQYNNRKASQLPPEAAKDGCLYIDGFNLVIILEVALSGSLIILGKDGVFRDLAGLRGTYSLIENTDKALALIGKCLRELKVPKAVFYLDKPVSNSGRLRNRILEHAAKWGIPVEVELVPNADVVIADMERIVTGDSVLLDQCKSWFNLSSKIIGDYIGDAWIVRFDSMVK